MTRINLVPVSQLTDQHLLAEYRELPRVFALASRNASIPKEFILGTGHVKFFYDKLLFLEKRLKKIVRECLRRGFSIKNTEVIFDIDPYLYNDYIPTIRALKLSRSRLIEKVKLKPAFYRYYGEPIACQIQMKMYTHDATNVTKPWMRIPYTEATTKTSAKTAIGNRTTRTRYDTGNT